MDESPTFSVTVVGESDAAGSGLFEFDATVLCYRGGRFHLWVGDDHFVADPDGCLQRGQHVLLMGASSGLVARIVETNSTTTPDPNRHVEVEYEYQWDASGVVSDPVVEYWTPEELSGNAPVSVNDTDEASSVRYVRPTNQ